MHPTYKHLKLIVVIYLVCFTPATLQSYDSRYLADWSHQKAFYKSFLKISILNKLDHSSHELRIKDGTTGHYGSLAIHLEACWHRDGVRDKNKALIKITENDVTLFHGWILDSSPGLSNLEHPIYYLRVLDCYDSDW